MNKLQFYESIDQTTEFNEDFFKKVYGYSICDSNFIPDVIGKLLSIGRKDVVEEYNKWFAGWKEQDDAIMKEVSQWFRKESERQWKIREKRQEKVIDDWEQRKIQLLTRKKELMKQKKELLQSQI